MRIKKEIYKENKVANVVLPRFCPILNKRFSSHSSDIRAQKVGLEIATFSIRINAVNTAELTFIPSFGYY